jgi:hypothetical protein
LQPSEELRWVLLRAFAPLGVSVPARINANQALSLSRALDVAPRIATRHAQTLSAELGADAARQMTFDRLRVVAVDRLLWALVTEIIQTANALGSPVVLLKYAALRRAGLVVEGERPARDVDLLVPEALATPLQSALIERGFVSSAGTPQFHLAPLTRRAGEVIEIHRALWGIQLPGVHHSAEGSSATSLIACGLVDHLQDGSQVPLKPILAAHAIVHGLVQHRTSPEGYPVMRVLADLCALDLVEGDAQVQCQAYAAHAVAGELIRAALGLSSALNRGIDLSTLSKMPAEFELLSHAVAASCDPAYRRALRFERVAELASPSALRRAFNSALSSDQPMSEASESGKSLARRSLRAARPVSLAIELARGAASYARLRLRRRL